LIRKSKHLEVVVIHLGGTPPPYVAACRRQVEAMSGRRALMVGPDQGASYHSPKLNHFRRVEKLSGFGLEGFWRYAAERFFVLEEFMSDARLERCIHLESDNLLYASPSALSPWMREVYGESLAVCPLTDTEDTAAVMYVGSGAALANFTEGLLDLVELGPEGLQAEHGEGMPHEMKMLHILRTELGLCAALPTRIADALPLDAQYVFDPGSYGQHVDGTVFDPGVEWAGEHHLVGRDLLAARSRLVWDAGREQPLVYSGRDDHRFLPLANLHIHSKRLDEVLSGRHRVKSAPTRRGIAARFRSTVRRGGARTMRFVRSAVRR
jgi:hypothetical protein